MYNYIFLFYFLFFIVQVSEIRIALLARVIPMSYLLAIAYDRQRNKQLLETPVKRLNTRIGLTPSALVLYISPHRS